MVTVPLTGSVSAMVRGIRSPYSSTRRMMNCPAFAFRAISGASTSSSVTVAFSSRFRTILTMSSPLFASASALFPDAFLGRSPNENRPLRKKR